MPANIENVTLTAVFIALLKAVAPKVTRVAILFNPETAPARGSYFINPLDRAAPSLGLGPSARSERQWDRRCGRQARA
jgi:hypothetical protein